MSRSIKLLKYFVDSVGVNEEIIRRYVRHQEKKERMEQQQLARD